MRNCFFACLVLFLLAAVGCKNSPAPNSNNRGFYYWKTSFELNDSMGQMLHQWQVGHLFVRLFDVSWDNESLRVVPVGLLNRKGPFPEGVKVTPVVFITVEALRHTHADNVHRLAAQLANLAKKITEGFGPILTNEVQVDCDWTMQTKETYFALLDALRKEAFFAGKMLTVTIRLHQVKYINESGIPPADRGLLMCYNMGTLRDPAAKNSIIDPATFQSYTGRLPKYPLPLDIALPLFDWWVWFRQNQYYGLVHAGRLPEELAFGRTTVFSEDTLINGYQFLAGDWLRHENSPIAAIEKIINLLPEKLKEGRTKLLLFHLDETSLKNYSIHEIEDFYSRFD